MTAQTSQKYDIVLVSPDPVLRARVASMGIEFQFSILNVSTVDELLESFSEQSIPFVILTTGSLEKKEDAVGMVQVARQVLQDAFIFVTIGKKMDSKSADFIRKSGADAVVLEGEFVSSAKLEFMAVQKLKATYLPVKGADFIVNTTPSFPVYALLSQNKKFMPIVHKGFNIDASRMKRMVDAGDLFVKRADVTEYYKYINAHTDASAEGLMRRCRSTYLTLAVNFADLVIQLTDQSESASWEVGKENLAKVETLAAELLSALMAVGKVWEVVSQSVIGDFGSLERSPTRAAYAGFLSLMSGVGKPEEMMLATMLSDIGLIHMSPKAIKNIRDRKISEMAPEDRQDYTNHPQRSVNVVLSRKVPLSQVVKDAILASHAQFDGKGFPELRPDKITLEAQMVQFVEKLDYRCIVEMGKAKPDFMVELRKLIKEEVDSAKNFNAAFLMSMEKVEV